MTHAAHILAALERFRCIHCGNPVGPEARGVRECLPCLDRLYALEARGINIPITRTIPIIDGSKPA